MRRCEHQQVHLDRDWWGFILLSDVAGATCANDIACSMTTTFGQRNDVVLSQMPFIAFATIIAAMVLNLLLLTPLGCGVVNDGCASEVSAPSSRFVAANHWIARQMGANTITIGIVIAETACAICLLVFVIRTSGTFASFLRIFRPLARITGTSHSRIQRTLHPHLCRSHRSALLFCTLAPDVKFLASFFVRGVDARLDASFSSGSFLDKPTMFSIFFRREMGTLHNTSDKVGELGSGVSAPDLRGFMRPCPA